MFNDNERYEMKNSVAERVYGYTGASGLIQALACGYFLWDLVVSTRYIKVFGIGIWAHAITALCVFSFGFVSTFLLLNMTQLEELGMSANDSQRPFCNYYGPVFILYELSSPFLNVHWFCDKLNMTGSKLQWYNGMILLATFFSCRLVWGTYQSARVYYDVWRILQAPDTHSLLHSGHDLSSSTSSKLFSVRSGELCLGETSCVAAQSEVMKFVTDDSAIPMWLIVVYLISNVTLNALNWYWFGKMIETVRKRFEGKPTDEHNEKKGIERRKSVVEHAADTLDREVLTGPVTPGNELSEKAAFGMTSGAQVDGGNEIGRRRKDL